MTITRYHFNSFNLGCHFDHGNEFQSMPTTIVEMVKASEYDVLAARVAELRRFAVGILDLCPHTECEGIQELAVNHGVLVEVTVTEPCGDNCECAEVSDFPLTCYRLAPEFADAEKHSISTKETT